MRGKGQLAQSGFGLPGIIPAGAGKSFGFAGDGDVHADHPRGCGEKRRLLALLFVRPGSSPRVRGKAKPGRPSSLSSRIIPAGAGKSLGRRGGRPPLRDHPRGCGEKVFGLVSITPPLGSSPRVRGKALRGVSRRPLAGIIPAGAGKSRPLCNGGRFRGDHPRGCGEKALSPHLPPPPLGSSPRVRGKENQFKPMGYTARIIPAGAGKRRRRRRCGGRGRDHPRGCGEKWG